jgi:hypothetical protein
VKKQDDKDPDNFVVASRRFVSDAVVQHPNPKNETTENNSGNKERKNFHGWILNEWPNV